MATTYRSLEIVPGESGYGRKYVWQAPVRLSHWINAFAVATLFLTGLYIANPALAPNGEAANHFVMGRVREIHFAAGYALLFGFLLRIYCFYFGNNYSRSGFHFVMGRVREIHFVSGYALLFGFLLRIYCFYFGNNYSRSGFPFVWRKEWWADLRAQAMQYLRLERGHVHLGHNALAGLVYTFFVIFLGWCQIFTGFALY